MGDPALCFIDVDGVLNSKASRDRRLASGATRPEPDDDFAMDRWNLDGEAVARLRPLVDAGVSFVLSSAWRAWLTAHRFKVLLASFGVHADVVGTTPEISEDGRGSEIVAWMSGDLRRGGESTAYRLPCPRLSAAEEGFEPFWDPILGAPRVPVVVLDDDPDGMGVMRRWLVNTRFDVGLTDDDVRTALSILGRI